MCPIKKVDASIPAFNNSTNEMRIITPAENPIMSEMNFLLGSLTKNAIKLPIVVDNPAKDDKIRAYNKVSIFIIISCRYTIFLILIN